MRKKVLVGISTIFLCCAMFFSFNVDATNNQELEITTVRFRKDKVQDGIYMQCVAFSLTKCEFVKDLHK